MIARSQWQAASSGWERRISRSWPCSKRFFRHSSRIARWSSSRAISASTSRRPRSWRPASRAVIMGAAIFTYRTRRRERTATRPRGADGASNGRAGARRLLPVPADAGRQGRHSPAERRRRTDGRFAQHADWRLGQQPAARRVPPAAAGRQYQSAAEGAVGAFPGADVPVFVDRRARKFRQRSLLRRIADQDRRRARWRP